MSLVSQLFSVIHPGQYMVNLHELTQFLTPSQVINPLNESVIHNPGALPSQDFARPHGRKTGEGPVATQCLEAAVRGHWREGAASFQGYPSSLFFTREIRS